MAVRWIEVRYACPCRAIVSVNALVARAACDRCQAPRDLGAEWTSLAGLARDETTHDLDLPLEVTVRVAEAALCDACRAPVPETELDRTVERRRYVCACGATICLRPTPDDLAPSWPAGVLVGEDEGRLDDPESTRPRGRRRFYSYVSKRDADRRAGERRARRIAARIASFCRDDLASVREKALAGRRIHLVGAFVLASLCALGALLPGSVYGQLPGVPLPWPVRAALGLLALAFLGGDLVLLGRYLRFRALAERAVVVLAHRRGDAFVFDEEGEPRTVLVAGSFFERSPRPPRAAFVALSPEDPTVALLADATFPEASRDPD